MSRVYQKPPAPNVRRPPAARSPHRPTPSTSTANRGITRGARGMTHDDRGTTRDDQGITRGARAPIRGRSMHTQPPRQERNDTDPYNEDNRTKQSERITRVGDGFHMITPSITKRDEIRRQAENEQRQYEAHVERSRLRGIHEVHRLGGDELTEDEVRQRQAEKYRHDKSMRLEKIHQDQSKKKQDEERELEAKKQEARRQSMENEKRDRDAQRRIMRPTTDTNNQEAAGWTKETREKDRQETMDRFLNRFNQEYADMNITSNDNETNDHNSEKLSILRDMLPHVDDETLKYYLEIYNGNVDAVVHELLN